MATAETVTQAAAAEPAPARPAVTTGVLVAHMRKAAKADGPIDPALATAPAWARALRMIVDGGEAAVVKHVLPLLDKAFANLYFARLVRRYGRAAPPAAGDGLAVSAAIDEIREARRLRRALDPAQAAPAVWAEAIRAMTEPDDLRDVSHVIDALIHAFPGTYFEEIKRRSGARAVPRVAAEDKAAARALIDAHSAHPLDPAAYRPTIWASALETLVTAGRFDTAARALPVLVEAFPKGYYFRRLTKVLARRPPFLPVTAIDPEERFQVIRRRAADAVVLVFSSGVPLALLHQWLGRYPAHIIYMRQDSRLFMRGVPGLAAGFDEALAALSALIGDLGVERVLCIGGSAGGYAAARYAVELAAQAALLYNPLTHITDEAIDFVIDQAHRHAVFDVTMEEVLGLDLARHLPRAAAHQRFRIVHSGKAEGDTVQMKRLEGLPGVEIETLPKERHHNSMQASIIAGLFEKQIAWLFGGPPA